MAIAGAWTAKRTACIFSAAGVYEALDPLMSSAYMGVKGGLVIACVKDGDLDVTPLGLFSKLPVLVSDGSPDGLSALSFAFDLSERYEIPCMVETLLPVSLSRGRKSSGSGGSFHLREGHGEMGRDPPVQVPAAQGPQREDRQDARGVRDIRGQRAGPAGEKGLITHHACRKEAADDDVSILSLGSVFPLPQWLVSTFIDRMEEVRVVEGPYAAIGLQVKQKGRIG